MSDPRVWTVAEANALVPRLKHLVGQQMLRASEIERSAQRVRRLAKESLPTPPTLRAGSPRHPREEVDDELPEAEAPVEAGPDLEAVLQARIEAYEKAWKDIEALGVVVKDPRSGLCDFYGRVEGKLVWLCWRYGEDAVEHYHDLDAGFSARKPLRGQADRWASSASAAARRRLLN